MIPMKLINDKAVDDIITLLVEIVETRLMRLLLSVLRMFPPI